MEKLFLVRLRTPSDYCKLSGIFNYQDTATLKGKSAAEEILRGDRMFTEELYLEISVLELNSLGLGDVGTDTEYVYCARAFIKSPIHNGAWEQEDEGMRLRYKDDFTGREEELEIEWEEDEALFSPGERTLFS